MTRADEYLKKPYARLVVPEADGSFRAEILEFPGCIALGDTPTEALTRLEDVAADWLDVTLAKGQRIPEPTEQLSFSGKLVVRLPKSLHRKATYAAERDNVSLNQFIVGAVAEQVGARAQQALSVATPQGGVQYQQNNFVWVGLTTNQPPLAGSITNTIELTDKASNTPWGNNART